MDPAGRLPASLEATDSKPGYALWQLFMYAVELGKAVPAVWTLRGNVMVTWGFLRNSPWRLRSGFSRKPIFERGGP